MIVEINRGNCAQIFGDLFQLLDRSDNGFSTYPIEADSDLQNEIKKAFAEGGEYAIENGLDVDDAVDGYTSNYGETLSDDIKNGRVLLLPNNLYIWATMNTSDQSLFPIDSAFKRRWDWRYVKIADAGKGWKIRCGNEYCDWWKFVEEINKRIAKETSNSVISSANHQRIAARYRKRSLSAKYCSICGTTCSKTATSHSSRSVTSQKQKYASMRSMAAGKATLI